MAEDLGDGSTAGMDEYETLMSTTDVELLKTAWRNEKAAPEILQFQAQLVKRAREQIQLMVIHKFWNPNFSACDNVFVDVNLFVGRNSGGIWRKWNGSTHRVTLPDGFRQGSVFIEILSSSSAPEGKCWLWLFMEFEFLKAKRVKLIHIVLRSKNTIE